MTHNEQALLLRHNELLMQLVMISENRDLHFREREIRRELEALGKMIRRDGVTGIASDGSDGA